MLKLLLVLDLLLLAWDAAAGGMEHCDESGCMRIYDAPQPKEPLVIVSVQDTPPNVKRMARTIIPEVWSLGGWAPLEWSEFEALMRTHSLVKTCTPQRRYTLCRIDDRKDRSAPHVYVEVEYE